MYLYSECVYPPKYLHVYHSPHLHNPRHAHFVPKSRYRMYISACVISTQDIKLLYVRLLYSLFRRRRRQKCYAARLLPCVLKGQSGSKRPPTLRSILTRSSLPSKRQSTLSPNVALQGCRRVSLCEARIVSFIQLGIRSAVAANCASGVPSRWRCSCCCCSRSIQSSAVVWGLDGIGAFRMRFFRMAF
jgi:hypothetical protein